MRIGQTGGKKNGNMLNDLAEAIRRWTEKNVDLRSLDFVLVSR